MWHDESVRGLALTVLIAASTACAEAAPHVDVSLDGPVLDAPPPASASAPAAPSVRTVASGAPEPTIETRVPDGACGPRDAPVVRETRTLTELEALPMILRRVLEKDVERCVAEAHERDATMEGLLVLSFFMKSGGGLQGTRVTEGAGDALLHRCVESVFDAAAMPDLVVGGVRRFPLVVCGDGRAQFHELGTYR